MHRRADACMVCVFPQTGAQGDEDQMRKYTRRRPSLWLFYLFCCCWPRRRHRGVNDVTVRTWLQLLNRRLTLEPAGVLLGNGSQEPLCVYMRLAVLCVRACARLSRRVPACHVAPSDSAQLCQEIRTQGKPLAAPAYWISPPNRLCRKSRG